MMTSYFNLLKYAATGIASPSMTYFDKMRASTLMGGAVQALTGIPPLSFKSNGTPLISWSMKGNGSQTGTPTPDNPVTPEFVGVRTGNLFDLKSWSNTQTDTKTYFQLSITLYNGSTSLGERRLNVQDVGRFALTSATAGESGATRLAIKHNGSTRDLAIGNVYGDFPANQPLTISFDVSGYDPTVSGGISLSNIMLNAGDTALPYEPFGWAEKITCAGQTVPVYLGQVSTVRRIKKLVLTGDERFSEPGTYPRGYLYMFMPSDAPGGNGAMAVSTHYKQAYNNNGQNVYIQSNRIVIVDATHSTAADFKAYLAAQYAAGTPVTIWYVLATPETGIVNEPLCKIGDYADELHSTDAGVTIPTVKGSNTLTVDTTLQPSEMTITFKG